MIKTMRPTVEMNVKNMSGLSRVLTFISVFGIIAAIFYPIWRIELAAPQYPEGLYLSIWADKLAGDVNIINGLNHYIGMATLHADEFVEFTVLPYILWGFAIMGMVTTVLNKKKLFYVYFWTFLLFAVVAMVDFWRWEYNYGHNLDPQAPIQVPGMAYQPPLIGYKQLLNFGAYSIPDKGGWSLFASGIVLMVGVIYEWMKARKKNMKTIVNPSGLGKVAACMLLLVTMGCKTGPTDIRFGKDVCDHCKMVIMDKKFGGEIITTKGKCFRFDDTKCLVAFSKTEAVGTANIEATYLLDYYGTGNLLCTDSCYIMSSSNLHGPMGGNVVAFKDETSLNKAISELKGTSMTKDELMK